MPNKKVSQIEAEIKAKDLRNRRLSFAERKREIYDRGIEGTAYARLYYTPTRLDRLDKADVRRMNRTAEKYVAHSGFEAGALPQKKSMFAEKPGLIDESVVLPGAVDMKPS